MDASFLFKLADMEQQFKQQEAVDLFVNIILHVVSKKIYGESRRYSFKFEDGRDIQVCSYMSGVQYSSEVYTNSHLIVTSVSPCGNLFTTTILGELCRLGLVPS